MWLFTSAFFRNTFFQATAKVVSLFVSLFVITPLLTSYLRESGYGVYTFLTAIILFFGSISDWGTNIISVREASSSKRQDVLFGTVAVLRLALCVFVFLLLNVAIRSVHGWADYIVPATVGSFVLFFLSLKTSMNIIFQTRLRYDLLSYTELVSTFSLAAMVFWVTRWSGGVSLVMLSWVVATLLSSVVGIFLALRISRIKLAFDIEIAKMVFKEAIPTGTLLVVFVIYNRIDTIILHYFKGEAVVGAYGLAYRVYDSAVMGAAFVMNSVFPLIVRMFKSGDHVLLRACYKSVFGLIFVLGFFVAVVGFLFAPLIISILGSGGFQDSVGALRVLMVALFFAYINHLTGFSLIAFGKQRISLLIAVVALGFNLALSLVFIPKYSYLAAAYITVATEALVLLLSSVIVFRVIRVLSVAENVKYGE